MLYSYATLFLTQFKAEDEDIQGGIELDGDDLLFNQAIEEFIQVRYIIHHGHMDLFCHLDLHINHHAMIGRTKIKFGLIILCTKFFVTSFGAIVT